MEQIPQIAVFVDIENLIGFCTELQLPIDLADVLEKLKEEGRITVRRSFGDIVKALSAVGQLHESTKVRRMLRDNLFSHEDIPYVTQHKNSADMRLAVEALYTAFALPNITKFAIVSGDSDYVPLFLKLKEQSRSVIGITGSEKRTPIIYRRSCDSLFYFDDLSRVDISASAVDENGSKPPTESPSDQTSQLTHRPDIDALRDDYASLLLKAFQVLQQGGNPPLASAVHMQMRQLQADFNLERAGFASLHELIRYAEQQNLIIAEDRGNDLLIKLPSHEVSKTQSVSSAQYRMYIQERLKCQLPSAEIRREISEHAYQQIVFNQDDGGILLRDLSLDVTDELSSKRINVAQQEVFKYLYSLYRARCFSTEPTEFGEYNPRILGFRAQKDEWDDHFVGAQVRLMSQDTDFPLYPLKLSKLFYETEDRSMHIKRLMDSLGLKYEN